MVSQRGDMMSGRHENFGVQEQKIKYVWRAERKHEIHGIRIITQALWVVACLCTMQSFLSVALCF